MEAVVFFKVLCNGGGENTNDGGGPDFAAEVTDGGDSGAGLVEDAVGVEFIRGRPLEAAAGGFLVVIELSDGAGEFDLAGDEVVV